MTLQLRPPRRDPRPLVVRRSAQGLAYAALDAWELRGHGVLNSHRICDLTFALRRLVLQIKPTIILLALDPVRDKRLVHAITEVAKLSHLVAMPLATTTISMLLRRAPTLEQLAEQYPEAKLLADDDRAEIVRLAARSLTHLALPPRSYAPRHIARTKARVAAPSPSCACRPRGALPAPALSPRGRA